ncbi:hypothetical protein [Micromonospora sp. WMMD710]|uniref:hypothetical protein n=1 Tax=Micromonospora sp. WMMD710 TaxID=3016085 RepID=UPI0024170559|nr:hypothetical protein [Micromonospora sp. WMMD710]MDG4759726.1 hypothetical protein [Micromonospora sp. WMMD710]
MALSRRISVLPLVVCLLLSGCAQQRDGDTLAENHAAAEAKRLDDDLTRDRVRDAEWLVATHVPKAVEGDSSTIRREAFAWSGRTGINEQAVIDVRITVTVAQADGATFGDLGNSAGQATRCYRYRLELHHYLPYQEIDCPSGVAPPVPSAAPFPALPTDARDRLSAALRTATPDTLAGAVRAAFPAQYVTVDTATHEGVLVAAVGVPAERECLLLIRTPAGTIESPEYNLGWLEPGETGCRVGLYVSPPR